MIKVKIPEEDSKHIEDLYYQFVSYSNLLALFSDKPYSEGSTFEHKWAEAVKISNDLERAKHDIEVRFKPEGEWGHYDFDFENSQVIFYEKFS